MLDLAVVSGMPWAVAAAQLGVVMLTLPFRDPGAGGRQDHIVPATLPEDRLPFIVSSAGDP